MLLAHDLTLTLDFLPLPNVLGLIDNQKTKQC